LPGGTTTTVPGGTTTTVVGGGSCPTVRAARAQFNAQLDALVASLSQSLTGATRTQVLAQLQAARTSGNATLDQLIANCPPGA
jgi:hypothetical protein